MANNYVRSDRVAGWDPKAYERARVAAGLSFARVAEIMGVSLSTAARWAGRSSPPASLLFKLARTLHVSKDYLIAP